MDLGENGLLSYIFTHPQSYNKYCYKLATLTATYSPLVKLSNFKI